MPPKRNYSVKTFLTCDLDRKSSDERHVLKDPRRLPCNKMVCLSCVKRLADRGNEFICSFCSRKHNIGHDLTRDMMCEYTLDENIPDLSIHFTNKLKLKLEQLKLVKQDNKSSVENMFDFISTDLLVRVESLKIELDRTRDQLHDLVDRKQVEVFTRSHEAFNRLRSKCTSDQELRYYENITKQLSDIHKKLNNVYQAADKYFDSSIIGILKFKSSNKVGINNISQGTEIQLDFNPYDFTPYLNGSYLFTDNQQDCLYIINRKFDLVKKIEKIGDTKRVIKPKRVTFNKKLNYVSIWLSSSNEIIITDTFFSKVLHLINQENLWLARNRLIRFAIHSIDILEYDSQTIRQVASRQLECDLKHVCSVDINDSYMAVNLNSEILVYNLNLEQVDRIKPSNESDKFYSIYLENETNHLFVHLNNKLACYNRGDGGDWDLMRQVELASSAGSWTMKFVDEKLVLVLWSRAIIII